MEESQPSVDWQLLTDVSGQPIGPLEVGTGVYED